MARRRLGPPSFITDLPPVSPVDAPLSAAVAEAVSPAPPPVSAIAPMSSAPTAASAGAEAPAPAPRGGMRPPIASIAGQSAAEAALNELAEDFRRARDEGRLVQEIALAAVDESHLVRDRIVLDGDELEALKESIRARGQQMPIEVVDLGQGRFGLISGWRRLTALRALAGEDAAFGTVKALLRRPAGSAEAYRAMVEENEIRVGLSYYERARIAARAVGQGVFPDTFAALAGLFPTASRAKRSKIGSFIRIHDALDEVLRFPAALPERLGLELAKALEDPARLAALRSALTATPAGGAQDEQARLVAALSAAQPVSSSPSSRPREDHEIGGIRLTLSDKKLVLSGRQVDRHLLDDLSAWLARRKTGA